MIRALVLLSNPVWRLRISRTFVATLAVAVLVFTAVADGPTRAALPGDITVVTFNSRADWTAAIGAAPTFVVDFESFTTDTSFGSTALDLGPFVLTQIDAANLYDQIDVPPFCCDLNNPNATTFANLVLARTEFGGIYGVDMNFEIPVVAFGADFKVGPSYLGDAGLNQLVLNTASGPIITSINTTDGFFGFISPEPFNAIRFQLDPSVANGAIVLGMDNVVGLHRVTVADICAIGESASQHLAGAICAHAASIAAGDTTERAGKLTAFDQFLAAQNPRVLPDYTVSLLSRMARLL